MCGWAGSDGRCGRALRGTLATGTDGYSPRRLGVMIALRRSYGTVRSSRQQIGFSTGCTAAISRRHNASSTGADRLSGRQIGFSATDRILGAVVCSRARFKFGFDRNCAELGHPRPEAETSPRKRPHRGFGLLDLSRRRPPASAGRRPAGLRQLPTSAGLRPPRFSSAPRPANGARPAAPA